MSWSNRSKRIFLVLAAFSIVFSGSTLIRTKCGFGKSKGVIQPPKNIILLISDGCGYNHVDAASLYQYGKTDVQVYEDFPVRLAMSTYAHGGKYNPNLAWKQFNYVKNGATDSAASATAMSTGLKTYSKAIGVDIDKKPILHIIERAEELGKDTGVVTSVQFSHATPASFVAHNKSRDNYEDIAKEMIHDSSVDVIMGCGHPFYDSSGKREKKPRYKYVGGISTWNELVAGTAGGDADGDGTADPWALIQGRGEFQALISGPTPGRVLGVARVYKTLQENRSGDKDAAPYVVALTETVPTLEEMGRAALNILDENPNGFFLMVEGGAIDSASHSNWSGRVTEEEIDFNRTVEAVVEWVRRNSNWDETLVIVTGDHETGYLTGPDSKGGSDGPVWKPLTNNGKGNLPGMKWHSKKHTNSLIPFYAKGCGAKLFKQRVNGHDPVRGHYIDNTDIGKVLFELLKQPTAHSCANK